MPPARLSLLLLLLLSPRVVAVSICGDDGMLAEIDGSLHVRLCPADIGGSSDSTDGGDDDDRKFWISSAKGYGAVLGLFGSVARSPCENEDDAEKEGSWGSGGLGTFVALPSFGCPQASPSCPQLSTAASR